MNLFYTPPYAKTGDVIPFYNESTKRFENFYLKNWNPDAPKELITRGWHKLVTEDNLHFQESPTGIEGGTGSVLKIGDVYHMFYCTFDFDVTPVAQWARHAVSTDMEHWTDIPEEKFGPDGNIYAITDWRDPHVFWNDEEQKWWMLLAARENAPTQRSGCVALCVSDDLAHWEYRKPIFAPRIHHGAYECPDMFKMGDWYYLVFSNYCDGFNTYYRMSRSPSGPWIRPKLDTFDGRAFYAAKTGSDGVNRYIYGWNPTRGENAWGFDPGKDLGLDYTSWNWGGSIVVHKLIQHEDGTLGVCPAESVEAAFGAEHPVTIKALDGNWDIRGDCASCGSPAGYASAISDLIPTQCRIRATLKYDGEPTRFGIALQMDENFDFGYYLMFEPDRKRIQFRSGLRMYEHGGQMFPYAVEMERPFTMEAGREYSLELYIDGTIGVLYVDHDLAFGFRMYNWKDRRLGFFVEDGTVTVTNASIAEIEA